MSFSKTSSLFAAALLVAKASAHGLVTGIVADGVYYPGYSPNFQYEQTPPVVAGWSIPEDQDTGFVSDYNSPDIVCHKGATPGGGYVTVAAGDTVKLEWTVWPESHHGPVMDYLASCNGDCTKVDKTALLFNKIDEGGLIDGSPPPGTWASDTLIANNNSWTVTIPPTIAAGKYVLRHEIIALHSADNLDGSQAYPQCVNLEITGSGTNTLSTGTVAQKFYKDTDPGIYVNIYYPALTNYTIPGPALIADAVSITQPTGGSAPVVSSAKPATTTSATTTTTTTVPTGKIAAPTNIGGYPSLSPTLTSTTTSASATGTKPSHFTAAPTASLSTSATSSFTFPGFPPFSKPTTSLSSTAAAPTFSKPTAPTFVRPTSSSSSATTSFTIPAYGFPSHPVAPASTSSSTTAVPTYTNWAAWESTPVAPLGTSSTSPVSFTSTITGRIGRPTKFTCYIDED